LACAAEAAGASHFGDLALASQARSDWPIAVLGMREAATGRVIARMSLATFHLRQDIRRGPVEQARLTVSPVSSRAPPTSTVKARAAKLRRRANADPMEKQRTPDEPQTRVAIEVTNCFCSSCVRDAGLNLQTRVAIEVRRNLCF
jgi:hypothetical protein